MDKRTLSSIIANNYAYEKERRCNKMTIVQSLLQSVNLIRTLEGCDYTLGYITAEYVHDFIAKSEYDMLFDLIQNKRSELK